MIYILIGSDTKNKSIYINDLTKKRESFSILTDTNTKDILLNYSANISLFGETPVVIVENLLSEENIGLGLDHLQLLKDSETLFIFKEDKLLAVDQKKYKKYGNIEIFESKKIEKNDKFNVFSITDAFEKKDKINAWTLYREAIVSGVLPESIAGVLFWKIKTLLLKGSRSFSNIELKKHSSSIISIYHKSHRGELDFEISLEQFILNSLSSR